MKLSSSFTAYIAAIVVASTAGVYAARAQPFISIRSKATASQNVYGFAGGYPHYTRGYEAPSVEQEIF